MRELIKATVKMGSSTAAGLLMGIIIVKIMAVILGPSGVGLYSLLRQTRDFSSGLGTMGGMNALVQGLASREGRARDDYLVTTFWIFVLGSLLVGSLVLILAPWIALWVFDSSDSQTTNLVRWLALPVALSVITLYFNGLLNGFRAIGALALFQILGAATMLLLAYPVSRLVEVGYTLAFVGMMSASQVVALAFGVRSASRAGWLTPLLRNLRVSFHSDSLRHFFSSAGVQSIAALMVAGVVLAVRSLILRVEGLAGVGIFDVAWTLSTTYIMLVAISFGAYYLPTLSQAVDPEDRVALIQRVMRLTTLIAVPLIVGVVVLKPLVVEILYSVEFTPALNIIRWMLIGDYFKMTAYVLAMPVLAYVDMKVHFWTTLLWSAGFIGFAALSLFGFGNVEGVAIGFTAVYVVYVGYFLHYVRSRHQLPLTKGFTLPWLLGLALIVGASWSTWSDTQVDWLKASLWIAMTASFSWLLVTRNEKKELLRLVLKRKDLGK